MGENGRHTLESLSLSSKQEYITRKHTRTKPRHGSLMCLTFSLAFISLPHFAANINFLLEQTGLLEAHCGQFFYKRTKWERIGRCCTIIPNLFTIIYAWNLIWRRDKCTLFPLPLSLSYWWPQVSWTKCKASNERTVTLSYWKLSGQKTGQSGLWGSRTLPPLNFADTHSEPLVRKKAGGERKKKSLNWWGLNMNGFKLSTW